MTGQRVWASLAGLVLVGSLPGCGAWPEIQGPGLHTQAQPIVSPRTREVMACAGDVEAVTVDLAERLVAMAIERNHLTELITSADRKRAATEMTAFLKWKLGKGPNTCIYATTTGIDRIADRFADATTAVLLGLVRLDGAEPRVTLPSWLVDYLNQRIEVTASLEPFLDSMGLPVGLAAQLRPLLAKGGKDSNVAAPPLTLDDLDRLVRLALRVRRHLQDETQASPPSPGLIERAKMRHKRAASKPTTPNGRVQVEPVVRHETGKRLR